jgi:hypothetical protein
MMTTPIISAALFILFIIGFFVIRAVQKSKKRNTPDLTGAEVVETLDTLGYFKYANPDQLERLKKEIGESYDQHKTLSTINSEEAPFEPYCYRLYFCDGEILFDRGGISEYLADAELTFLKMGIPLDWSDEYFSRDYSEHTVVVNGKKYFVFRGDRHDPKAWDRATRYFVELLNDQLKIHRVDERVYPILGKSEGRLVFLTRPQYEFISRYFDNREKPKSLSLWWKENT